MENGFVSMDSMVRHVELVQSTNQLIHAFNRETYREHFRDPSSTDSVKPMSPHLKQSIEALNETKLFHPIQIEHYFDSIKYSDEVAVINKVNDLIDFINNFKLAATPFTHIDIPAKPPLPTFTASIRAVDTVSPTTNVSQSTNNTMHNIQLTCDISGINLPYPYYTNNGTPLTFTYQWNVDSVASNGYLINGALSSNSTQNTINISWFIGTATAITCTVKDQFDDTVVATYTINWIPVIPAPISNTLAYSVNAFGSIQVTNWTSLPLTNVSMLGVIQQYGNGHPLYSQINAPSTINLNTTTIDLSGVSNALWTAVSSNYHDVHIQVTYYINTIQYNTSLLFTNQSTSILCTVTGKSSQVDVIILPV